jgi:hypothetical protein
MVCESWFLIHLIGLTMEINFKLLKTRCATILLVVGSLAVAAQIAVASPKQISKRSIGLIDARDPGAVTVALNVNGQPEKSQSMSFLRLSDPKSNQVECCVTVQTESVPSTILRNTGLKRTQNIMLIQGLRSTLTSKTKTGFVGVVLPPGIRVKVERLTAQKLVIQRPTQSGRLSMLFNVKHCLSQEGLHVWLQNAALSTKRKPQPAHYYLPLGMDTKPNCPTAWLLH